MVEHGAELHVFGVLQCSHRAAELPRQMQTLQTWPGDARGKGITKDRVPNKAFLLLVARPGAP